MEREMHIDVIVHLPDDLSARERKALVTAIIGDFSPPGFAEMLEKDYPEFYAGVIKRGASDPSPTD